MRKRHPPFRRRKLAKKLRKMRLRARMSIQEAARALDKDVQALYRIEAGETRVDVHFGRSVMDVYDAYEPELLDEIREAAKRGWWTTYGIKDQGYLDVETEAATVREFALALVPGLLQTIDYMRAVFATHGLADDIENQVRVRQIRQRRLTSDDPLFLHVIIDEYALRRLVGSPADHARPAPPPRRGGCASDGDAPGHHLLVARRNDGYVHRPGLSGS